MKGKTKKGISGLVITSILATSLFLPQESIHASAATTTSDPAINKVGAQFVNEFRNRKKSVKTYKQWSSFKRASDNVKTAGSTGSIRVDRTVTFHGSISGNVTGIKYDIGKSRSSTVAYTMNVPKHSNVYMGYRVRYRVEEGINEQYDIVTGKVMSRKKYKVKKILEGEYQLRNVKK